MILFIFRDDLEGIYEQNEAGPSQQFDEYFEENDNDDDGNPSGSEYDPVDDEEFEEDDEIEEIPAKKSIRGDFDEELTTICDDSWQLDKITWKKLFAYQKDGVKWLLKKYDQGVGCILADEMGLGKTVQAIAMLKAIELSKKRMAALNGKGLNQALIVCPASLLNQWIKHFNEWYPRCRIVMLHNTSYHRIDVDDALLTISNSLNHPNGCVLLTTYKTYVANSSKINKFVWHAVILDEGHAIKCVSTKASEAIRGVATPHRVVLTGTPIQNNLYELWSLIEFVYPGKLGPLKAFHANIIKPIHDGSFLNASDAKKAIAHQCAIVLQHAVCPYILRRLKSDTNLALELPQKSEQVGDVENRDAKIRSFLFSLQMLFCKLTSRQRKLYENYVNSDEVTSILENRVDPLVGITKLAHLCNHPAIFEGDKKLKHANYKDSGKLIVLRKLLKRWHREGGNKVLLFTQKKTVIAIVERILEKLEMKFLTMSGETPVARRAKLVEQFEKDPHIFVFLLTTRVGGVGLNLVAANKIVIFDPDWNPTNDQQAKERAWRIGQHRDVAIYRLITSGTIEEKIYLRQIHKEALVMKVLEKKSRSGIINRESLAELFRLVPDGVGGTEVGMYVDGEIAPDCQIGDDRKSSKKTRKLKKDLENCIDKKALSNLFKDQMLTAIISHADAIKGEEIRLMHMTTARQYAQDAARFLLHVENRPSTCWKAEFDKDLKGRETTPSDEVFKKSDYFETVHRTLSRNDGSEELNERVKQAQTLRELFLRFDGKIEKEKIEKYFKPNQRTGLEYFFFNEVLHTLSRFNSKLNVYELKKKYF
ncbi:unnamed protein product [Caenorhabditis bovis]|uniref:DNA repair and recombination protein RAD54-like n=1 Tax=Caenorhabditis bovis TaxID=2654633 RepID=A0A8S1EII6_9PELO|nr:unnamed protein product [Caenorhabditis bovis]